MMLEEIYFYRLLMVELTLLDNSLIFWIQVLVMFKMLWILFRVLFRQLVHKLVLVVSKLSTPSSLVTLLLVNSFVSAAAIIDLQLLNRLILYRLRQLLIMLILLCLLLRIMLINSYRVHRIMQLLNFKWHKLKVRIS